jgi:hypothetical protein
VSGPRSASNALRVVIVAIVIFAVHTVTIAQETGNYESRPVLTNARSLGMGDAMVADIYDVSTMGSNPSSLAFIENRTVILDHYEDRTIHSKIENIAVPFSLGAHQMIAFAGSVRHVGYIGNTGTGDLKVLEYGYSLDYAAAVTREVSLGGALDIRYGRSDVSDAWAVSGSFGILYYPSESFSYGAVLHGIGHGITYIPDPAGTMLGLNNLPGSIDLGLTMRYPTLFRPISFTISLSDEKVFGEFGIVYRGGLEVIFNRLLVTRIGYLFESGPRIGTVSFGLGLRTKWVNCDYAIAPQEASEQLYRFSLAFLLR